MVLPAPDGLITAKRLLFATSKLIAVSEVTPPHRDGYTLPTASNTRADRRHVEAGRIC